MTEHPRGAYAPLFETGSDRFLLFVGHDGRECGEHRTVGSHRAWCFDCGEWCYPNSPCVRCERPFLLGLAPVGLREVVARAIAEAADDGVFDRDDPDCTSDDEDRAYWLRLADAALSASANDDSGVSDG